MGEAPGRTETLPCGCRFYNVDNAFVIEPHDEQCPNYLYVLGLAQERDMPVTKMEL